MGSYFYSQFPALRCKSVILHEIYRLPSIQVCRLTSKQTIIAKGVSEWVKSQPYFSLLG